MKLKQNVVLETKNDVFEILKEHKETKKIYKS